MRHALPHFALCMFHGRVNYCSGFSPAKKHRKQEGKTKQERIRKASKEGRGREEGREEGRKEDIVVFPLTDGDFSGLAFSNSICASLCRCLAG